MTTGLPFDDIRALLAKMPGVDEKALGAAREREALDVGLDDVEDDAPFDDEAEG